MISGRPAQPVANAAANRTVRPAITASGRMMSSLRFHRSAQTPPNMDTTACGRHVAIIAAAMTEPESDRMTRCQKMAYCTTDEPSNESVCPVSSSVTRRFQAVPRDGVAGWRSGAEGPDDVVLDDV